MYFRQRVVCDWPFGTNEYWTALLLMRLPCMLYTHWKTYPSRAVTLSTPVTVTLCSMLFWNEYINPEKAVSISSPPSTVWLWIQFGSERVLLCLHMRVSWSEQFPPWSSRDTLKAAVRCVEANYIFEQCTNCQHFIIIYSGTPLNNHLCKRPP